VSEERNQPVLPVTTQAEPLPPAREPGPPPRRPRRLALAVAVGLVAGTAYVGVRGALRDETPAAPAASASASRSATSEAEAAVNRAANGGAVLQRLANAVLGGDRGVFDTAVDPTATAFAAQARQMYDNLRALPVASLVLRYVNDDPDGLTAARRQQLGGSEAWVANVEVSWRLKDYDQQPVRLTVPMTLVTRAGTTYVASFSDGAGPGQRRPFWMLGEFRVHEGDRSLIVSTDPKADLASYARIVDQAIEDVTAIWGGKWSRRVVLYLPANQNQMEYVLGARLNTYGQIAAVTTAEAAERVPGVPVRMVANPVLFRRLNAQGRRIVLTHETTHVASNATASAVPLWLAEGFADYVAFATVDVSTSSAANELFKAVRAGRSPKALPAPGAFAASSKQLAIAYESSWLACRLIATKYGQSELVEFYRTVHAGNPTTGLRDAFRTKLGTTQERFVVDWQRYLQRLADD
jgi:hypothetical protein